MKKINPRKKSLDYVYKFQRVNGEENTLKAGTESAPLSTNPIKELILSLSWNWIFKNLNVTEIGFSEWKKITPFYKYFSLLSQR